MSRPRAAILLIAGLAAVAVTGLLVVREGSEEKGDALATDAGTDLIFWTGCEEVAELSDADLDAWQERGVDGFVCMSGRLAALGGDHAFAASPGSDLSGPEYALQRSLEESGIAERAAARGMKLYLGTYLTSYRNLATPLADWFDDEGWSQLVLPEMRELAGAAHRLGFAGLAVDGELYPQRGGARTATWEWDYPGNTHTEAEVRAQATRRGAELMETILGAFPAVELAVYHHSFPGGWNELVQERVNGKPDAASDLLHLDFWDGMTSVEGYEQIRFYDAIFYKSPHFGSWEGALAYNQNRLFATFSRGFSNWDYAASRVQVSPFSWIDPGPNAQSDFDDANSPAYVREQLLAFQRWSTGGEFANYVYGSLEGFDYSPYESALQAASDPPPEDAAPTIEVRTPRGAPSSIEGVASDDLAIRAVRWSDDAGGSGTARLRWRIRSGAPEPGYEGETLWSIPASELTPGAQEIEVVAEDIHGSTSAPAIHRRGTS